MGGALDWLGGPWSDPLTLRALVEVGLLGASGGAIGCWLVLYRLSYAAESLAHALLPGLVIAALAGAPLLLGGAGGVGVAAAGVALAGRIEGIERDTAVGVVVTTLFGAGVLLALSPATPAGLEGLLFGDVLGVSDGDLALAAGLLVVVAGALWIAHPRLLAVGFDRGAAAALGVRGAVVDAALLGLLALVLLVAVQGLGNLLVVAVLIAPASAARLVRARMGSMMLASALLAVLAGIVGLYVSYYAGAAAGASIALALVACYPLAALVAGALTLRRRGSRGMRLAA